jgi:hypothetical protein
MANIVKLSDKSKFYLAYLLRKEFDNVYFELDLRTHKKIIETAKELGLTELAEEMESDLKIHL